MKISNLKSEIAWLFALAAVVTLGIISWSFQHGRLQYEMDYEDVITHIDGLKRWHDISDGGIGRFLSNYIKNPPHCPVHSIMAATGFMLFGVKDWAPYVMNVFMLFAFLLLVRRETRVFGNWPSSLAVLGALFVPVSMQSIHQFRPDFPAALATLWGMVLYPRWREEGFGKKAALSGVLFGLALLSKPPFFPYTLAMGALPWMMAAWEGIREKNSAKGILGPILQSWPFFATTALVAGPHYLVAWRKILEYIDLNQFGENAHVWRMTGGLGFQLAYHVFGYSGTFMMGHAVWILLALVGVGLLVSMIQWKGEREESRHFLRLSGFTLWAWLFIAWNPHMNPFFGLAFQYGLVLAAMMTVSWVFQLTLRSTLPFKAMALLPIAAVVVIALSAFPFTEYHNEFNPKTPEEYTFARYFPRDVYEKLKRWREFSDSGYTLLSTYGIVSSHRLQWLANKDRQDFTFYGVPFWSLEKLTPLFDQESKTNHRVDFVLVTESGAEGVFEELPNSKTSGGLMEWLSKNKSYTQVETLLTPSKKKYGLFMATPNFSLFGAVSGLGPTSEPLNTPGKPVAKSATNAVVQFTYNSPAAGESKLELALRGRAPLAQVEVLLDGMVPHRFEIAPDAESFIEDVVPLHLVKGDNSIVIRLLDQKGNPLSNPSVQFRRLRITAPGDASPMVDIVRKAKNKHE